MTEEIFLKCIYIERSKAKITDPIKISNKSYNHLLCSFIAERIVKFHFCHTMLSVVCL